MTGRVVLDDEGVVLDMTSAAIRKARAGEFGYTVGDMVPNDGEFCIFAVRICVGQWSQGAITDAETENNPKYLRI